MGTPLRDTAGGRGATHRAAGEGGAGAVLDDAHAEAGQAAGRLAGAQVEMVGTAGGTAGTLHVGLGGDITLSALPRAWGHAERLGGR